MPNRILREGILTSPRMAKLGWAEEVFYRRLMSVVDDFGRYYADPGMLRAACYPRQLSKVTDPDVGKWTRSLVEAGLVRVYRAKDRECYVEMLDFRQQARAKVSKFPDPDTECEADATQMHSKRIADAPVFVDVSVSVDGGDKRASAPGSVRPEVWQEWLAYKGRQKPGTVAKQAKALDEWAAQGMDANAIIETSIRNSWMGLFPTDKPPAKQDARAAVAAGHFKDHYDEPRDITAEVKRVA